MNQKKHKHPIIIVEGNVGVGKSTFLNYLQQNLDAGVIFEPNQLWQNVEGHNLLDQFFQEPKRWSYTCQSYILFTRIDQILTEQCSSEKPSCFIERSIYSGRYCFAKVAHEIGWMNDLEWILYQKLWDREIQKIQDLPAGFIYLKTSAEICLSRIKQRARFEEKPISLDYLKRIEEKYDNWFLHKQGIDQSLAKIPVLILDFSQDLKINANQDRDFLVQIEKFIATL
jgi:deoxyadenosine/deoxycytidine kinase